MPNATDEREAPPDETHRPRTGCARSREALSEACAPCPERDGVLRRELLCRCPVALGMRLMVRIERHGADPVGLSAAERASLDFQERALARRMPPFDAPSVARSAHLLGGCARDPCDVRGCLHCRAARVLAALA
jgi:hypothetical protein